MNELFPTNISGSDQCQCCPVVKYFRDNKDLIFSPIESSYLQLYAGHVALHGVLYAALFP